MSAPAIDVALIDAGGANLGSVRYALERLGVSARVVGDADGLAGARRVILPGVGAAGPAMRMLQERGFVEALQSLDVPLLGVCLGMQLLYESSEEGDTQCLGLLPGRIRRLRAHAGARVPHMGWNTLRKTGEDPLLDRIDDGAHVYFVHGYAAPVDEHTIAACEHGDTFAAIVRRGQHVGAQFHPERSSAAGSHLLANFLKGTA